MLTRECFLECTFNWLDYSTGIKDETQTHCFTGFSRMVSLVIPNVGFASLLTQSPHLILGCAWTALHVLMALQGLDNTWFTLGLLALHLQLGDSKCSWHDWHDELSNHFDVANLATLSLLFPRLVDWCRFSTLGAQETHSIDSIARCLGVFAFLPTHHKHSCKVSWGFCFSPDTSQTLLQGVLGFLLFSRHMV